MAKDKGLWLMGMPERRKTDPRLLPGPPGLSAGPDAGLVS